jgi:hypothetical protein
MQSEALPPQTVASPPTSPANSPAGRFLRAREWFWRGRSLRAARGRRRERSASRGRIADLARRSHELATLSREPVVGIDPTTGDALASELYRQSIYWSLLFLQPYDQPPAETDFGALLESVDPALWAETIGGPATQNEIANVLAREDFSELCNRTPEERSRLAGLLGRMARGLLSRVAEDDAEIGRLWFERVVRLGSVFFSLALVGAAVLFAREVRDQRADIAFNKPWRASSESHSGCGSPLQFCDESPKFFFHTKLEKDPWVEIDLGAPTAFSKVRVGNRKDCCLDRAVPLVVEVSDDQTRWREIARRDTTFSSWKADVKSQRARYVRLRSVGRTMLHLSSVRVLP